MHAVQAVTKGCVVYRGVWYAGVCGMQGCVIYRGVCIQGCVVCRGVWYAGVCDCCPFLAWVGSLSEDGVRCVSSS